MENKIDLSKCVKGQKCVSENMGTFVFKGPSEEPDSFVLHDSIYPWYYNRDGTAKGLSPRWTIIKILPLEQPESVEGVARVAPIESIPEEKIIIDAIGASISLLQEKMASLVKEGDYDSTKSLFDFAERLEQIHDELAYRFGL